MLSEKIWTHTLTNGIIVIDESFGIQNVAIELVSGVGTFAGTLTIGTYPSTPIPLRVGNSVTISADSAISSLIIDCSAGGVINIIGTRN